MDGAPAAPGAHVKPNSSGRMQPYDDLGQYASPRDGGWSGTGRQGRGKSLLALGELAVREHDLQGKKPRRGWDKGESRFLMGLNGEEVRGEISESEVYGRADHKGRLAKKSSVRDDSLDHSISDHYEEISEIFAQHNVPLVVTSANDSSHGKNSLHYKDKAVDLRGNHITKDKLRELATEIQKKLGRDYDVLPEEKYELDKKGNVIDVSHIHIEYDPKPKKRKE
ncbi:hypothetical protein [Desulfovibrio aminophilus]|uniref:hypothetical protein n=1 Tax=Desulfovibrio aminophilus TaxID=81425 RepID=UPI003397ABA0